MFQELFHRNSCEGRTLTGNCAYSAGQLWGSCGRVRHEMQMAWQMGRIVKKSPLVAHCWFAEAPGSLVRLETSRAGRGEHAALIITPRGDTPRDTLSRRRLRLHFPRRLYTCALTKISCLAQA